MNDIKHEPNINPHASKVFGNISLSGLFCFSGRSCGSHLRKQRHYNRIVLLVQPVTEFMVSAGFLQPDDQRQVTGNCGGSQSVSAK
jgi:hypothetical protein